MAKLQARAVFPFRANAEADSVEKSASPSEVRLSGGWERSAS
ncbi:MAG: hypothetical protein Q8S33_37805 [Myxococcales bacterium]|nr:hypothetical protein [Myxococcales bacterium]